MSTDFKDRVLRLMLQAEESGEPVKVGCESEAQADHYRRRMYSARRDFKNQKFHQPPRADHRVLAPSYPWDAYCFSIEPSESQTCKELPVNLVIRFQPDPVERMDIDKLKEGSTHADS